MQWLYKQASKDLPGEEKNLQSTIGKEHRYDVYAKWDELREGLTALIADKEKLEKFILSKAHQSKNTHVLQNMGLENYDPSKFSINHDGDHRDQRGEEVERSEQTDVVTAPKTGDNIP